MHQKPKGKWWGGPLERYRQGKFATEAEQLVSSREWKQNMLLGGLLVWGGGLE